METRQVHIVNARNSGTVAILEIVLTKASLTLFRRPKHNHMLVTSKILNELAVDVVSNDII